MYTQVAVPTVKVSDISNTPFVMSNHPQAAVLDNAVYLGGGYTPDESHIQSICKLDLESKNWSFHKCPHALKYFGLAVVDNKLLIVGGISMSSGLPTDIVFMWDVQDAQFNSHDGDYPPLPEARSNCGVVEYNKWLVVIGGKGMKKEPLDSIMKLDTQQTLTNRKWIPCMQLPMKCSEMSIVVVQKILYVFGSTVFDGKTSKLSDVIFRIEADALILGENVTQWETLEAPFIASTAAALTLGLSNCVLLAVGGRDSARKESNSIFYYSSGKWDKLCDLKTPLYHCACALLPDNDILIVGGHHNGQLLNSVSRLHCE